MNLTKTRNLILNNRVVLQNVTLVRRVAFEIRENWYFNLSETVTDYGISDGFAQTVRRYTHAHGCMIITKNTIIDVTDAGRRMRSYYSVGSGERQEKLEMG